MNTFNPARLASRLPSKPSEGIKQSRHSRKPCYSPAIVLLLFLCVLFVDNVKASDVYVQVYDIVAGNPTKRPVTVQLTKPTGGLMVGPWTVAGDAVTVLTGADGKAWFSNMWVIGQYRMDITGNPPR